MVYKEGFKNPEKLVKFIRAQTRTDLRALMKGIANELIEDSNGDMRTTYDYFSSVFDSLYHDLIFNKIAIQEETKQLLEILATPIFRKTPEEQKKIIDEYIL
ncbi:hypothetical protein GW819_00855 [Candidatus Gracilibacteria bacterium]|nr:hypothetical protein [Candidatus Gracilibacteria bacterium]OIO77450.1 MAG: hypothetical protein AUJ87_01290 [Candidatus Gracilibacteria bacterium CG1_02_38_174]PIQ10868.1 MAG: hypothetical protein COW68_03690 [Candidatus Gracilibacteria bacterium CG18_big_fil_WC_8_21_14_2_50_38_16]PIQ41189.1 MAG: hypothetical protein COW06_03720 [Candidatus Gracilibacteria bacterium CG12_big_fil_rev_8_21_14_0_65_38_15]PIZ01538.1 MAG: hypothetical protein COY60_03105 [Candidatus Gracilibacteria bacterium CG_4